MDAFVIRSSRKREEVASDSRTASLLAFNDPKKYVVKAAESRGSLNLIPKVRGQQRISDLKGVVSLDKIEDIVHQLKDQTVSVTTKVGLLRSLRAKQPATQLIKSTGIGKIVRQLSQGDDVDSKVKSEAAKVYKDWKALVESRVEKKVKAKHIEVACDQDTVKARQTTVSLLRQALIKVKQGQSSDGPHSLDDHDKVLTDQIEKCLFKTCGNLLSKRYRRSGRKIVFDLTYQKKQLALSDIEELVAKHSG